MSVIHTINKKVANLVLYTYIKNEFPEIKRGDAINMEKITGSSQRRTEYKFWDGKKLIEQCTDYSEYEGGGPPLSFKTFTEFPMNYFKNTCWFDNSVYLDYDTFVEQIRNLKPTKFDDKNGENYDEDADDEHNYELIISYNGESYSLPLNEAEGNYSLKEYIEIIKKGKSKYIMLVNSNNQIVDVNGNKIYNVDSEDDDDDESDEEDIEDDSDDDDDSQKTFETSDTYNSYTNQRRYRRDLYLLSQKNKDIHLFGTLI